MSIDHYQSTDSSDPRSREEVRALSDEDRFDFMARCSAEPADFINCLACYAYGVEQNLSDAEMAQVDADRRLLEANPPAPSAYRLVLEQRNRHAESITELSLDDPRREYRQAFLDGLDRALDVLVREFGTD